MNWVRVEWERRETARRSDADRHAVELDSEWIQQSDWSVLQHIARLPVVPNRPKAAGRPAEDARKHEKFSPTRTADELQAVADSLLKAGRFRRALQHYERARSRHPNRADLHWGFGYANYRLARYCKAVSACEMAVQCEPFHDRAFRTLGHSRAALENWPAAVEAFQRFLLLKPNDVAICLALSRVYRRSGEFEKAVDVLSSALALAPSNPTVHLNLGLCLLDLGQSDAAVACLERLESIDEAVAARLRDALASYRNARRSFSTC
jgi:tetratricopeptide (TPR) repeat protein